jgi:hypothetical protein
MRVSQWMTSAALGAWKMLFSLARPDHPYEPWAISQIKTWWPSEAEQSLSLIESMGEMPNLATPVIESIRTAQVVAGFRATAGAFETCEALSNQSNLAELNVIPADLLRDEGDPYYIFVATKNDARPHFLNGL